MLADTVPMWYMSADNAYQQPGTIQSPTLDDQIGLEL